MPQTETTEALALRLAGAETPCLVCGGEGVVYAEDIDYCCNDCDGVEINYLQLVDKLKKESNATD